MELHSDFCDMFFVDISEIILFNVPIKNRHRVGGVKTPPYGLGLGQCVKQQFVGETGKGLFRKRMQNQGNSSVNGKCTEIHGTLALIGKIQGEDALQGREGGF